MESVIKRTKGSTPIGFNATAFFFCQQLQITTSVITATIYIANVWFINFNMDKELAYTFS